MKRKTINAVIAKRMKAWWDSIEDDALRAKVEAETIVTGGCIASMFLKEEVRDFDVYLGTYETVLEVANYYTQRFCKDRVLDDTRPISVMCTPETKRVQIIVKSAGVAAEGDDNTNYQYFESRPPSEAQAYVTEVFTDPGEIQDMYEQGEDNALATKAEYRPVFLSTNAITLSDRVQIIIRFYGTAEEIHTNYDFVHCTMYWTKKTGVVTTEKALESVLTKELRYTGSLYPVCSIIRIRKFVQRGWQINAGQILKMCMQVSVLDLMNIDVLKDQLIGVDVAYFNEVIDLMKERDNTRVDGAYLLEIIDRMF